LVYLLAVCLGCPLLRFASFLTGFGITRGPLIRDPGLVEEHMGVSALLDLSSLTASQFFADSREDGSDLNLGLVCSEKKPKHSSWDGKDTVHATLIVTESSACCGCP
jgi:hypothetical protein